MSASDTILISPETFVLGDFIFRLRSRDHQALNGARKLYASTGTTSAYHEFDIDDVQARIDPADPASIFQSLISKAYRQHVDRLYIDGCVFMTDRQQLVLLAGASHSGKTTLTVAAAKKLGWKIVCEDLTVVASSRIVSFVHPLSLRPGAQDLIMEATGIPPSTLYLGRWLACQDLYYNGAPVQPKFSQSVLIETNRENPAFSLASVGPHEFLRSMLPLTNAIHLDNALDLVSSCIVDSQCHVLSGGSVGERLEFLAALAP